MGNVNVNTLRHLVFTWYIMHGKTTTTTTLLIPNYGDILHKLPHIELKILFSYYSRHPAEGAGRPVRGCAAPRIPCGGAAAPLLHGASMRCFRLLEDEGACLNVPHRTEEEAELMRKADRQPRTATSPQRL